MRVQLKKKGGKVRMANLISAKRLPNAAGGQGGKARRKFHVFSSKNALDWLILSQFLPLIL